MIYTASLIVHVHGYEHGYSQTADSLSVNAWMYEYRNEKFFALTGRRLLCQLSRSA